MRRGVTRQDKTRRKGTRSQRNTRTHPGKLLRHCSVLFIKHVFPMFWRPTRPRGGAPRGRCGGGGVCPYAHVSSLPAPLLLLPPPPLLFFPLLPIPAGGGRRCPGLRRLLIPGVAVAVAVAVASAAAAAAAVALFPSESVLLSETSSPGRAGAAPDACSSCAGSGLDAPREKDDDDDDEEAKPGEAGFAPEEEEEDEESSRLLRRRLPLPPSPPPPVSGTAGAAAAAAAGALLLAARRRRSLTLSRALPRSRSLCLPPTTVAPALAPPSVYLLALFSAVVERPL